MDNSDTIREIYRYIGKTTNRYIIYIYIGPNTIYHSSTGTYLQFCLSLVHHTGCRSHVAYILGTAFMRTDVLRKGKMWESQPDVEEDVKRNSRQDVNLKTAPLKTVGACSRPCSAVEYFNVLRADIISAFAPSMISIS